MSWMQRRNDRRKIFISKAKGLDDDDDDDDVEKEKPFKLSDYDTLDTFDKVIDGSEQPELADQAENNATADIRKRRKKAMENQGYA